MVQPTRNERLIVHIAFNEKGQCYYNALMTAAPWASKSERSYEIVHGVCVRDDGTKIGHAWLEWNEAMLVHVGVDPKFKAQFPFLWPFQGMTLRMVYDPTNEWEGLAAIYYRMTRAHTKLIKIYSVEEAKALALRAKHFGPWDKIFDHKDILYNRPAKKRKKKISKAKKSLTPK
jgi:hypothetical protein